MPYNNKDLHVSYWPIGQEMEGYPGSEALVFTQKKAD